MGEKFHTIQLISKSRTESPRDRKEERKNKKERKKLKLN